MDKNDELMVIGISHPPGSIREVKNIWDKRWHSLIGDWLLFSIIFRAFISMTKSGMFDKSDFYDTDDLLVVAFPFLAIKNKNKWKELLRKSYALKAQRGFIDEFTDNQLPRHRSERT